MTVRLYDSAAREKRAFHPMDETRVTLYVCGPTVYNYAHIGNARPAVAFDTLFRVLRWRFGADHVVYARNITDVDDKIITAAAETGEPISAITEKFTRIYREDMGALNVLPPSLEPLATAHIPHMINLVQDLVDAGAAYPAEGHVLFHVAAFERYGELANRSQEDMIAGARVEVAPYKKDPADFVLWKPAKDEEPGWDSPWGRGRPGWHLECSAMIREQLGETIDIHGGGQDLKFPHHENERAQSMCAHDGAPLANYWMHNGFLTMDAEKMSKSLGNVKLVHELVQAWPGEVLRLALLSCQYRQPLNWTDELLRQSKARMDGFYDALRKNSDVEALSQDDPAVIARLTAVTDALQDDLNTPAAFAALSDIRTVLNSKTASTEDRAAAKGAMLAAGDLLGLLQEDPNAWFQTAQDEAEDNLAGDAIDALLDARQAARKSKDFAEADRIRDELVGAGIVIEDGPQGSTWRRA